MAQPSSKASQVFEFNTHELPRRAGEMKEYQLDLEILEPIGVPLVSVPAGDIIEVDLRLESVTEGVLLSADLYAIAKGECIRCLDPVEIVIERKIQELYNYEPSNERGKVFIGFTPADSYYYEIKQSNYVTGSTEEIVFLFKSEESGRVIIKISAFMFSGPRMDRDPKPLLISSISIEELW